MRVSGNSEVSTITRPYRAYDDCEDGVSPRIGVDTMEQLREVISHTDTYCNSLGAGPAERVQGYRWDKASTNESSPAILVVPLAQIARGRHSMREGETCVAYSAYHSSRRSQLLSWMHTDC